MRLFLLALAPAVFLGADTSIRGFPSQAIEQQQAWELKARAIPKQDRIREYMRRISEEPHHAGSRGSKAVADYLVKLLHSWGLDASIEEFESLLPTPTQRKLEMLTPAKFQAQLKEPALGEDKDTAQPGQLPTYNAFSANGDVTAPLVYVNYGGPEDYELLKQYGIDVKEKIVIARYGTNWRGAKPKLAYEHGAAGCLIYSDPKDDGYFAGDVYPKGAFRPRDGVQRGSVMDMTIYPGDPLSPGWASEKGSRRLSLTEAKTVQKIPVLPISYADAIPLLRSLGGPVAPEAWRGALPLTYHMGPGPAPIHLLLEFDWSTRPIYNVIARIPGSEFPDQWVMYGNHHDAWVNGASDPASGAAALLETARSLAELIKLGWKPKRTVLIALWDAEEFGLIGSTEWAEKHAAELDRKLVAYLNSDMNGKGRLRLEGSHTLEKFMAEVARDVTDPLSGKTLLELGLEKAGAPQPPLKPDEPPAKPPQFLMGPLGSGSDYTVFVHHLGVASLNMGFSDNGARGVYHSIYDSFEWYSRFWDTSFSYGRALSQITTTALLRLADAPLLPFDFQNFSTTIHGYLDEIERMKGAQAIHLDRLRKEMDQVRKRARSYERRYSRSIEKTFAAKPDLLRSVNETLYRSERALLQPAGLPGRDWFKHQVYAPGLYTGYGAKTLPGIREAAEAGRWEEANRQAEEVTKSLRAIGAEIQKAERALAGIK